MMDMEKFWEQEAKYHEAERQRKLAAFTKFTPAYWEEEQRKVRKEIQTSLNKWESPLRLWTAHQKRYVYDAPKTIQDLFHIYTRVSSGAFNDRLRGADTDLTDKQWAKTIPEVRRVMKETKLPWNDLVQMLVEFSHKGPVTPIDVVVWRGIYQYKKENYKVGDLVRDPAFASHTFDPFFATGYIARRARLALKTTDLPKHLCCLFRVELPAGTHVLYDEGELQVILPPLTCLIVTEINTIDTAVFTIGPYGMDPHQEATVDVFTLRLQRIPPSPIPRQPKPKAKKKRRRQPL